MYTYTVTSKTKDQNTSNITITADFNDGNGTVYARQTMGATLTDDAIAQWAATVISALETRDANFDAITIKTVMTPPAPDPAIAAAVALRQAVAQAQFDAQVAQLAATNPDVAVAQTHLQTVQASVATDTTIAPAA